MKKHFILILLLFISFGLFGQNRSAKGYVLDKDSRAAIKGAEVRVKDEKTMALTNESGEFIVEVPMKSYKEGENYAEKRLENDSLFLTYKNAVSISLIEFFAVGLGLRYERILTPKHALGMHATYYFYGISPNHYDIFGEYQAESEYTGIKLVPFYRFYLKGQKAVGFFLDAKIPFGYFDFEKIVYANENFKHLGSTRISPNFWTWGFGASIGIKARMAKHGFINFSVGGQYFPMVDIPESIPKEVGNGEYISFKPNSDWWNHVGPGAYVEVKLTIGGIF